MLSTSIPVKFQLTWGQNAPGSAIRIPPFPSQQSIQAGAASFNDGFPSPACFLPTTAGGTPPFGVDFNGVLSLLSAWNQWMQAGGGVPIYDATFSSQITGYPTGAILSSQTTPGQMYQSLADNNQTNPDSGGRQNWNVSGQTVGDVKWRPTSETLPGWAQAIGTTIGSATSGATQLASPDAKNLFIWLWSNFSNTQCPVSGGRGASALADFNANKTIQVLDMRGTAITGADANGSTKLNGVPVTNGNTSTPGSLLGENLHSLIAGENGPHGHGITDPSHSHPLGLSTLYNSGTTFTGASNGSAPFQQSTQPSTTGITVNSQGSGTGHNTVALSLIGTWYLKL